MKKFLFLLLLTVAFFSRGQCAFAQIFNDVQDHWAKGYIGQLSDAKVISGYPDGAFRPEDNITRAEFIKALVISRSFPLRPAANPTFTDVNAYHWHYPYIETAVAAGVIIPSDYVQSAFNPDGPITRVDAAMFLSRSLGLEEESTYTGFDDGYQIPGELRGYIRAAKERGLIAGYPDGTFRPWNPITRSEASAILVRYIYEQGKGKGLVTICYDHQLSSVYNNAFSVHKAYGYPGVNYVCTSSVGSEGTMTVKQLKEMEGAGWETASHSANHLHFKDLEEKDIRDQLARSKLWLQQQGLTGENFAYPFRFSTAPNRLVQEYYNSGATSYDKEINVRPFNPYKLCRYYLQNPSAEEIKNVLEKTVADGGWVIFYTHSVYEGGQTPDSKSINQDTLKLLFDEVAERNIQVVTVKQGLQLMAGR
ncbi:MAG: Cellulosome-anchoring protein precursor [Pelotomaculum sp. PtaB.Bin104]|nr:MAG: Cellulosome-anchoring protein precursor [Pelotomaculum sp. PtaB.Bin104]